MPRPSSDLFFSGFRCVLIFIAILFCLLPAAQSDSNSKLKKCCEKLTTDDKDCVNRFCDFDAISQANVLNYLSTCTERGETVGHMWDCASSRVDHTKCCESRGVSGKCLEYCSAHDGVPTNYLDYLYVMLLQCS